MTRKFSFWVLLAVIALVGAMFYRVMSTFLLPLFLAVFFAVVFDPVYGWLLAKCKQRRHVAAGLATTAVVLVVLLPTAFVVAIAASEGLSLVRRFDARAVSRKIDKLRVQVGLDVPFVSEKNTIDELLGQLHAGDVSEKISASAKHSSAATQPATGVLLRAEGATPTDDSLLPEQVRVKQELARTLITRVAELHDRLVLREATRREKSSPAQPKSNAKVTEKLTQFSESVQAVIDASDIETFDNAIHDAEREWEEFKLALLGGPTWALLKEKANPGPKQIRELTDKAIAELQTWLLPVARGTTSFAARFLFGSVIMLVAAFFFFADGQKMIEGVIRLVPLDVRHQAELLADFGHISRAVVSATLASALVQGLLSGLGFWVAGVDSMFLLTLLALVAAMIPFVGAAAVWIPVSVWLFAVEERTWPAVLLAIYGAAIVSQADNFVKPMLLRGRSHLHPLLALLSILGGVQALGPVGIVVGPMLVVFLQTLLNILHRELITLEEAGVRAKPARVAVHRQKSYAVPPIGKRPGHSPSRRRRA